MDLDEKNLSILVQTKKKNPDLVNLNKASGELLGLRGGKCSASSFVFDLFAATCPNGNEQRLKEKVETKQQTIHCWRLQSPHPTCRHMFLHLQMYCVVVNSSSSGSIEMEKYSEIRQGLELPAKALRLIWSCGPQHRGIQPPTCKSLYPGPALCTIHILIFLHFTSNKFHENEQRIRGVSVLDSAADTAAYTGFLSPLLARPWLWKIRDRLGFWPHRSENGSPSLVCRFSTDFVFILHLKQRMKTVKRQQVGNWCFLSCSEGHLHSAACVGSGLI